MRPYFVFCDSPEEPWRDRSFRHSSCKLGYTLRACLLTFVNQFLQAMYMHVCNEGTDKTIFLYFVSPPKNLGVIDHFGTRPALGKLWLTFANRFLQAIYICMYCHCDLNLSPFSFLNSTLHLLLHFLQSFWSFGPSLCPFSILLGIHAYMHTYIYTYTHAYMHMHSIKMLDPYVCMYVCMYVCNDTYFPNTYSPNTYINIYTHIMHTCREAGLAQWLARQSQHR